jgi:hypothetical protein
VLNKGVFPSKLFANADASLKAPSVVKGSLQLLTRDNDNYPEDSPSNSTSCYLYRISDFQGGSYECCHLLGYSAE